MSHEWIPVYSCLGHNPPVDWNQLDSLTKETLFSLLCRCRSLVIERNIATAGADAYAMAAIDIKRISLNQAMEWRETGERMYGERVQQAAEALDACRAEILALLRPFTRYTAPRPRM